MDGKFSPASFYLSAQNIKKVIDQKKLRFLGTNPDREKVFFSLAGKIFSSLKSLIWMDVAIIEIIRHFYAPTMLIEAAKRVLRDIET